MPTLLPLVLCIKASFACFFHYLTAISAILSYKIMNCKPLVLMIGEWFCSPPSYKNYKWSQWSGACLAHMRPWIQLLMWGGREEIVLNATFWISSLSVCSFCGSPSVRSSYSWAVSLQSTVTLSCHGGFIPPLKAFVRVLS